MSIWKPLVFVASFVDEEGTDTHGTVLLWIVLAVDRGSDAEWLVARTTKDEAPFLIQMAIAGDWGGARVPTRGRASDLDTAKIKAQRVFEILTDTERGPVWDREAVK